MELLRLETFYKVFVVFEDSSVDFDDCGRDLFLGCSEYNRPLRHFSGDNVISAAAWRAEFVAVALLGKHLDFSIF